MKSRLIGLILYILIGVLTEPLTWGFELGRYRLIPTAVIGAGTFPQELQGQTWRLEAQGGQSYVFISQDGTHVLKFFKDEPRPYLKLPSYLALKTKKLHRTLTGYALLHNRCQDLSGTVCIHTHSTAPIAATLIDRLGISHSVDLNAYLFVLQKKAEELKPPTTPEEKEALISAVSALVQTLSLKHLSDHDPRLHLNLGTVENKLIVIDPGRIAETSTPTTTLPEKFLEFLR